MFVPTVAIGVIIIYDPAVKVDAPGRVPSQVNVGIIVPDAFVANVPLINTIGLVFAKVLVTTPPVVAVFKYWHDTTSVSLAYD